MVNIDISKYLVKPNGHVNLHIVSPIASFDCSKETAKEELSSLTSKIDSLQELLFAEKRHKLLVVLQAMDTAGKDGTIKDVFGPLNPQGVSVKAFGVPTTEELAHDYLWRVHPHTPGNGEIRVFNRSHYEDVLCVRVHNYVPTKRLEHRYEQIVNFEKMLVQEGTNIIKFYLHISKDEQKERLQERLDDPNKNWKFNPNDLKERELWDDYMQAYEVALKETSKSHAPWYIIPSNIKWERNLIVATVVKDALESMKMQYPLPAVGLDKLKII